MKLSKYPLEAEKSLMTFEFTSSGPRGQIKKIVKYTKTNLNNVYNLSFGDKKQSSVEIDDETISNNADSNIILATVVSTVYAFTNKNPDAWIFAVGSTKSRNRLYRMGLNKYILEIRSDFQIFGLKDEEWVKFEKDTEYDAFLVKRKLL